MRGDDGSLIGGHPGSRGDTPCWPGPKMRTAVSSRIGMTRTTAPTRSTTHCPSRSLLTAPQVLRREESGMETLRGDQPGADVRDYLAEERTFLAWIRTGL